MANPTLLTMPLCVNADKNTIPPTDAGTSGLFSEELGFQDINSLPLASGGKAPNRRDFNGVLALLGGIAYACQRGQTFEWVNTLPYLKGCVVTDPLDGNKYNAKNDVPAGGTNPSLDLTNWELFGVVDLSGKADTSLSNLTQTGEDHFLSKDFTIIYPNGGTGANPANISANSRYVESNPFAGYVVNCVLEIKFNNEWGIVGDFIVATSGSIGVGAKASQLDDGNIVIQTGSDYIITSSNQTGNPFSTSTSLTTAPCRVKVWKIGKIPT